MNFIEVWERITRETGIKNSAQLSEFIGVSQSAISQHKNKNNEFPIKWAFTIGEKYNLSTDWIMTGKGAKTRGGEVQNNQIATADFKKRRSAVGCKFLKDVEEWISERKEDEPKFETWFEVEFRKHFPDYRRWAQRRNEIEEFNNALPGVA